MEINNMKLRSEAVQDILTKPPRRLIRWGSTVIVCVLVMLFTGSFFIHYPDIVTADIIITTETPPIWIIARSTGHLKEVYKQDHELVQKGELIAVIDNPSETNDVLQVKSILSTFSIKDSLILITFPTCVKLGEIQKAYSSFIKSLEEYNQYFSINIYGQKIISIRQKLDAYKKHSKQIFNQIAISKKNVELSEKEYKREEWLYAKGLIDLSTFENAEKEFLSAKMLLEELTTSVTHLNIEVSELKSAITDLELQSIKDYQILKINLQSALDELIANIKQWEQLYILKSPNSGILSFNEIWNENQNVTNGDKVFSIVIGESGNIIGKLQFPLSGSGKVEENQQVNVHINGYPYLEYGFLIGKIETISLLPNGQKYTATVNIPQELITSFNKKLTFRGELFGVAEIVTDNKSLGERLIAPFKYISDKYFANYNSNKNSVQLIIK